MINVLTQEQKARFPEFIQKWTEIGLSTQPADRKRGEAAIRWMYQSARLGEPRIVWCDSPLANALASGMVRASVGDSVRASVRASVGDSVRASVRDSVGDSVRASVRASVGDSVRASVRASVVASVRASVVDSVGDSVGASVRDSVWASVVASVGASVRDSVWASVRDSVRDSVWASVGDSVGDSFYGSHESHWLSYYDCLGEVCGLHEQTKALHGLMELAQSAGWAIPYENMCFVSERHNILHFDAQKRLHCGDGPAVAYPDGFAVYAWHGVRVPEALIMQAVTREIILEETNIERRRVLLERVGSERFMDIMQAEIVSHDVDGFGSARALLRADVGERVYLAARYVDPSTGRVYVTQVPPEVESITQAMNFVNGFVLDANVTFAAET